MRLGSVPWTFAALPTSNPTLVWVYVFISVKSCTGSTAAVSFHALYMPRAACTFIYTSFIQVSRHSITGHGPRTTDHGSRCSVHIAGPKRNKVPGSTTSCHLSVAKYDVRTRTGSCPLFRLAARQKHMLALLLFSTVALLISRRSY